MTQQEAQRKFNQFPNVDEFTFTSDGTAFFQSDAARVHASTLADATTVTWTREQTFAAPAPEEVAPAATEETAAPKPKSKSKK